MAEEERVADALARRDGGELKEEDEDASLDGDGICERLLVVEGGNDGDVVLLVDPEPLVVRVLERVRTVEGVGDWLHELVAEPGANERVGVMLGVTGPEGVAHWLCELDLPCEAERTSEPVGEDD